MLSIAITGGLATGKSTLMKKIGERISNVYICPEPIQEWSNVRSVVDANTFDFLSELYDEVLPKFDFQAYAQTSVFTNIAKKKIECQSSEKTCFCTERTPHDAFRIFSKVC